MQARTETETTAGRLFSHLGERSKLSVKDHIVNILDFVSHIVSWVIQEQEFACWIWPVQLGSSLPNLDLERSRN